tara:strand:- start:267 stop:986 length:720 start_codon:yes stop_codon:yes gene_type:complete
MLTSWFKPKTKKLNSSNSHNIKHHVLGTYINSVPTSKEEEIVFACGCFWGAEKGFWKLPGVITTAVGYAGGQKDDPTYREVCSGRTGHTEVVRVVWDKSIIHLSDLLKMFWECHDPTQGNRQGNDSGTQYRSAIYTNTSDQNNLVLSSLDSYQKSLNAKGFGTITTEIKSDQKFFYAENYHQQYLAKPASRPYCSAMPTKVLLDEFPGSCFKLKEEVWKNFNWDVSHCVLRSDNTPIKQ